MMVKQLSLRQQRALLRVQAAWNDFVQAPTGDQNDSPEAEKSRACCQETHQVQGAQAQVAAARACFIEASSPEDLARKILAAHAAGVFGTFGQPKEDREQAKRRRTPLNLPSEVNHLEAFLASIQVRLRRKIDCRDPLEYDDGVALALQKENILEVLEMARIHARPVTAEGEAHPGSGNGNGTLQEAAACSS